MLKIVVSLLFVILSLVFFYEWKNRGTEDGDSSQANNVQAENQGCKELDALPLEKRQRYLEIYGLKTACEILFFESRKIDKPATFLAANQFADYKKHLSQNECLKAEQVLWQAYNKRYSGVPEVNFTKRNDRTRQRWRFFVLAKQVPETYFCIYKKNYEAVKKQMQNSKHATTPIRDLLNLPNVKSTNKLEYQRNEHLRRVLALLRFDYAPAQIYIIQQSMKGDIFTLKPSAHYRLLKRVEMFGKLPKELEGEFKKVRQKISQVKANEIDERLTWYSFFRIPSLPTIEKEKTERPSTP